MPTILQVRNGFITTVTAAVPGLIGYHTVPDVAQVPALVVMPGKCEYIVGMGSCQEWMYKLFVLVARTETNVNQDQLDTYLSTSGSNSVPAALRASPSLGVSGVDATLQTMTDYGGRWESAKIPHIGAQLNVRVLITE